MKIHYLKHVSFEGLGNIEEWCIIRGIQYTCTELFEKHTFPSQHDFDGLVIMGGSMSTYDEDTIPWLKPEKEFIRECMATNKPILGICLGSQLIADALGAKVFKNNEKEIGWFKVQITQDALNNALFNHFPQQFTTFHWHGDTFTLPENACHVAFNNTTQNQAFLYQKNIVGLQFHPEISETAINDLITNGDAELIHSPYIQNIEEIKEGKKYLQQNKEIMFSLLDKLFLNASN